MADRKYKHLQRSFMSSDDSNKFERTNQAYQDNFGTENFMQSPYTLDVDETKVTARRSNYPNMGTLEYFSGKNYNTKTTNMRLSKLVSAKMRERIKPDLQPGDIIDPEVADLPTYQYNVQDDTNIFLYLGAFVIGIVIFTSLV